MDSIFYIVCPKDVATGGPECLHQLCYKLRSQGFDARMYYYDKEANACELCSGNNCVNEEYRKYNTVCAEQVIDEPTNILITPETRTFVAGACKNIKRVIWWLSVDFYYVQLQAQSESVFKLSRIPIFNMLEPFDCEHLVHSEYARQLLLLFSINPQRIHKVSDYINTLFIEKSHTVSTHKKEDIVLYNPRKGFEFTKKLIQYDAGIKFIPIQGLSLQQVSELLEKAKVYIDFGFHPGTDHLPREAAISYCCVITGRRGSAKFEKDVPIPDEYKLWDSDENIPDIIEKIKVCFKNYDTCIDDFKDYREMIACSEKNYEREIEEFVTKIRS